MEFHISYLARKKNAFEKELFAYNGNVIFADFRAVREFVRKINETRRNNGDTEHQVSAGEMNALGLIDEIMHALIHEYRDKNNPNLNREAYLYLYETLGKEALEQTLTAFCTEFPPSPVYKGEQTVEEYLSDSDPEGMENRYAAIEEILLLWITNRNPAAMKLAGELFDESHLVTASSYNRFIVRLDEYLQTQPKIEGVSLVEFLRKPAIECPDSLFDQLNAMRRVWSAYLGAYLRRLLLGIDLIREETRDHGFGGPGPVETPSFEELSAGEEYEAFSPDSEWMPRLVLIAKNTYVWMDQLSKQYGYSITKLNEIPDAELENLSHEGFTGLWLIGLWERSKASQTIKQWCGNPEALASAYSLRDYRIADDLGGEAAFNELRNKARRYGIRLGSDLVPNHMGIDSDWVLYHPERFLSLSESPYPSYSFNCGNLSPDPNIGIRIEDHYFTRSDAAVVFQRIDYRTGDTRYIYHGNDGTTMPWNDTAQLDYLNPEVRETMIQTILDVAKRTPIIRFDAAMTLAKKQYQRLWFPEPGSGGDIASRAEHGLTKEEFDRLFPEEFWREVVDRVAKEAPGTLLLAEAFWMMENYFVRTLGMHRVYNSAFMNLLRDEDNARYRMVMKNTLEFDPEILKRYVNFMNNPDEQTAVEQFGKGDKYFGICILMATMPGLPMFGHGQIQGFSEKYGMEYKKAYYDERTDLDLLHRHEREVFPLLHMRRRFAEAADFALYNFANGYGNVDENVFAYSNYGEGTHSLVVYNNRYGETDGFIKYSVRMMKKNGNERELMSTTLDEQLRLHNEPGYYVVLHDHIRGLDYVRSSQQICSEGLYMKLCAYQYYVFTDIYEVRDDESGTWAKLFGWLNGEGTPNIREAMQEILLGHILRPYRGCFDGKKLRMLSEVIGKPLTAEIWAGVRDRTWVDFRELAEKCAETCQCELPGEQKLFARYTRGVADMLKDPNAESVPGMNARNSELAKISGIVHDQPILWTVLFIAQQERLLTEAITDHWGVRPNIHEEWRLSRSLERILRDVDRFELSIADQIDLVQWLYYALDNMQRWTEATLESDLDRLLLQEDTGRLLKTNYYGDIQWFNDEMSRMLCDLLRLCGYYLFAFGKDNNAVARTESAALFNRAADLLTERIDRSEFHFARLLSTPAEEAEDKQLR